MHFASDLLSFFYSDASSSDLATLITRPTLWLRNSLTHFLVSFALVFVWFHFPKTVSAIRVLGVAYCLIQLLQVFSPGQVVILALDGAWDILCAMLGVSFGYFLAMRGIPQ